MVRLAPSNYNSSSLYLEDTFIVQATEYAINPFETKNNSEYIATNVFEVDLYNLSNKNKVDVKNLT